MRTYANTVTANKIADAKGKSVDELGINVFDDGYVYANSYSWIGYWEPDWERKPFIPDNTIVVIGDDESVTVKKWTEY